MPFLVMCAVVATVLLVPSAAALGGSAARLSLARRERDLATIRLVGGTSTQVGSIAVLDVIGQCLLGSVLGIGLHMAVTPVIASLTWGFTPFTVAELVMPWWAYPLLVLVLTVLATASAAIALAGVVLSPLGVARDSRVVRMSIFRLVIWGVLAVGFVIFAQLLPLFGHVQDGAVLGFGFLALFVGALVAGANLVGPSVVWVVALGVARVAPWPSVLVAARRLAADPRAGWRAVSGITFAMIIAGFLTVITTLSQPTDPTDAMLNTALQTGGVLTLVIAAVIAAVGTGVPQTARVIDQAPLYRSQYVAGARVSQLQRARLAEIAIPVALSSLIASGVVVLVLATMMSGILTNPTAILWYFGSILGSYALVIGSVLVSAPLVRRGALATARA